MATRRHGGIASHHSAAQLHGLRLLKQPPGTVTLTVPPGTRAGRYRQDAGVICHAAELPDQQVTKRYGVPVTTAARTVADIARTTTFMEGVVVADAALYERHASKSELRRVLAGCERWPGTSRARQVIDFADGLAESVLESCARVLFRDHGLPPPELQVHITGRDRTMIARVDFFGAATVSSPRQTACSSTTAASGPSPSAAGTGCCWRRASRSSTSPGRNCSATRRGSLGVSGRHSGAPSASGLPGETGVA